MAKQDEVVRQLCVLAGDAEDKGKVFPLPASGTVLIGRASHTLTALHDLKVSREHCELQVNGDRVLLTNRSSAGTLVDGQVISGAHELRHGAVIQLGKETPTQLRFEVQSVHEAKTLGAGGLEEAVGQELKGLLGTSVAHFRLDSLLGEGATSLVFKARDTRQNRDVALKVFKANPKLLKALGQSFQMLQPVLNLFHAHLVPLYQAQYTDGYYWIAMEYVEGENLKQLLEKSPPPGMIDWQDVLRFGMDLASGLDALHQKNLVHRSITPDNVLVTRGGRQAKLGGLWRARTARDCLADAMDTEEVLRSVAYMPPERLRGNQPGSARGDIYSLGTVLYHLLAGRPPFEGRNDQEVIARSVQADPTPPREFQLTLPEPLERAILRMLAKQPEDRQQSALEVHTDLQRVAEQSATAAAPVGPRPPAPAPPGARPPASPPLGPRPPVSPPPSPRAPAPAPLVNPVPPPAVASAPAPAPAAPEPVPTADGKITVTCSCGQVLQARRQFAGTQVRCPCCKNFVRLPGRPAFTALTQQSPSAPSAAPDETAEAPAPGGWKQPPKKTDSPLREFGRYLVLVVLLLLTLAVSFSGLVCDRGGSQPAPDKGTPAAPSQQPEKRPPQPQP
jgi:serine/threonine-protein kinase